MNKIAAQLMKNRVLWIAAAMLVVGLLMGQALNRSKVTAEDDVCAATCKEEQSHAQESPDGDTECAHREAAHAHEAMVTLHDSTLKLFGIESAQAGSGKIETYTVLPAEIALNEDRKAHVVPRIPGVVRSVAKSLGDKVHAGDVLAVIHSRQLADFKAGYLAARETLVLNETVFERERNLWEKKITAEQDYLTAKRDVAEARIVLRSAEQKLHALGFSEDDLKNLPTLPEESYIVYEITAPIDGTIIEKHITTGEVLGDDSETFIIADLSDVWVNVNISQKDLQKVKTGQKAVLRTDHFQGEGIVSYVSGVVDESTRTALARIVLANDSGQWRPGTFATAEIHTEEFDGRVVIPKDAAVMMENKPFVFLAKDEGFVPQEVQLGRTNGRFTEVLSGLEPGQRYVAKGAFTLKSELMKSNEDPCGGQ
jgi:cobalt-zinc-cadmium efflux system membrane fusion protein